MVQPAEPPASLASHAWRSRPSRASTGWGPATAIRRSASTNGRDASLQPGRLVLVRPDRGRVLVPGEDRRDPALVQPGFRRDPLQHARVVQRLALAEVRGEHALGHGRLQRRPALGFAEVHQPVGVEVRVGTAWSTGRSSPSCAAAALASAASDAAPSPTTAAASRSNER